MKTAPMMKIAKKTEDYEKGREAAGSVFYEDRAGQAVVALAHTKIRADDVGRHTSEAYFQSTRDARSRQHSACQRYDRLDGRDAGLWLRYRTALRLPHGQHETSPVRSDR